MSVLVLADLHLDRWLSEGRDPFAALDPDLLASLDALFLAGDVANKPKVRWPKAFAHIGKYIDLRRVHVIPGNHDYYDFVLDDELRLAKLCFEHGPHLAQRSVYLNGGLRILSCTLWTDFRLHGDPATAMQVAQANMNDYRYIRLKNAGYRRIRPLDTANIHSDHRMWLEERLAEPFAGRTVVVTHHCPHPDLLGDIRREVDPAYGSDLRFLIETAQPEAWLFGHTHYHAETTVGRTTLRNVSLGYPDQVQPAEEAKFLLRGLIDLSAQSELPA
ncbi:metallophosphoesterase [Sulfitobacter sp. 915]|uniref:metallophosphoesterase n=1 Tax=Sulfitobacter sp. 915 TaxID=3368558 RepID=UPI003744BB5C